MKNTPCELLLGLCALALSGCAGLPGKGVAHDLARPTGTGYARAEGVEVWLVSPAGQAVELLAVSGADGSFSARVPEEAVAEGSGWGYGARKPGYQPEYWPLGPRKVDEDGVVRLNVHVAKPGDPHHMDFKQTVTDPADISGRPLPN